MTRGYFLAIFPSIFLILIAGFGGTRLTAGQSQPPGSSAPERFEFLRAPEIRVSVENGWQRDGRTPVHINLPGLRLELSMDEHGRVFLEDTAHPPQALFVLHPADGEIRANETVLTGRVVERNALRTRLRFPATAAAILLDIKSGHARLDLGGITIPLVLRMKTNAGGERELHMGMGSAPERGRWLLDPQEGSLNLRFGNVDGRLPARTVRLVRRERKTR